MVPCHLRIFFVYQEQIRQRKEEEERIAKQNEFLKSSIRSSKKLQAVESHPPLRGVVNDAYSDEESRDDSTSGAVPKFIRKCQARDSRDKSARPGRMREGSWDCREVHSFPRGCTAGMRCRNSRADQRKQPRRQTVVYLYVNHEGGTGGGSDGVPDGLKWV